MYALCLSQLNVRSKIIVSVYSLFICILHLLSHFVISYDQPRQHIKRQRHYFVNKGPSSQDYGFSSSHVWMWELDYKENWALKNWCFWTVVLEKTLKSPLDCKEIQPVHPKWNQSWIFIGRTDVEAETPILWPPDVKNWLIGKDPDAGEDWRQKGTTEDEMVGWHHGLNGPEFGWTLGVVNGQGGLASWFMGSQSWTWLNGWTKLNWMIKWFHICDGNSYIINGYCKNRILCDIRNQF